MLRRAAPMITLSLLLAGACADAGGRDDDAGPLTLGPEAGSLGEDSESSGGSSSDGSSSSTTQGEVDGSETEGFKFDMAALGDIPALPEGPIPATCGQAAQGGSSVGCRFYAVDLDTHDGVETGQFAVAVANTGAEDAMIMVTQGANMIYDTVVPANSVEVITLPWVNALTKNNGPSALVVDGAYRLRSDRPIVVYQYNPLQSTTTNDASLLLPTNAWGNDTVVASWPQWNSIPAFYSVVASEDNTTVNVNPPPGGVSIAAGGGVAANGSGQVVLNESDVLQVITSANNSDV
ncbi:MAG: IgGFc-binding protein, partial [Myxococcales bacterium]|nr:IgGFc-binding protein [Myxococcales bacterium]